ncbi:alpha/beta hydrolase [Lactococcus piscium]|uniref:Acetyl esterase n=1 Tax=Pseudolactococcus piscium MKFS47 TaxID=297352 RepID=A0A0D6DVB9_9LACT|nr:alpha/beta hydrolase family protein [Lactococcus piscium]CEN27897.1 Acetyl esterase [Lactococcus piscium MKFS47]
MSIFRTSFASASLFRTVNLTVIVPIESYGNPELEANKPQKFKTLYLLHGFGGSQDDWLDYTNLRTLAELHNLAIVLPAAENSFYENIGGIGGDYSDFVGQEIVDFTRRAFPLSDKREDTFIGGLSMGGFGALRLGMLYHKTFSKIISLSGAFIIDNITDIKPDHRDMIADYAYYRRIFGDLKQLKGSDKDPIYCVDQAISSGLVPEVYQAVGTEDFLLEENHNMRDALATRQICLDYHESSGIHDWQFWNTYLPKAIDWLLTE